MIFSQVLTQKSIQLIMLSSELVYHLISNQYSIQRICIVDIINIKITHSDGEKIETCTLYTRCMYKLQSEKRRLRLFVKIYGIFHLIKPPYAQTVIFIDFISKQEIIKFGSPHCCGDAFFSWGTETASVKITSSILCSFFLSTDPIIAVISGKHHTT